MTFPRLKRANISTTFYSIAGDRCCGRPPPVPDYRDEEEKYFAKTGIFPIMHVLSVRRQIYEAWPVFATSRPQTCQRHGLPRRSIGCSACFAGAGSRGHMVLSRTGGRSSLSSGTVTSRGSPRGGCEEAAFEVRI